MEEVEADYWGIGRSRKEFIDGWIEVFLSRLWIMEGGFLMSMFCIDVRMHSRSFNRLEVRNGILYRSVEI